MQLSFAQNELRDNIQTHEPGYAPRPNRMNNNTQLVQGSRPHSQNRDSK